MLTEAEARKKWCPFGRVPNAVKNGHGHVTDFVVGNRTGSGAADGLCLGSDCMAWRKRVHHENRDKREPEDDRIGKYSADGYCGLAGRPE